MKNQNILKIFKEIRVKTSPDGEWLKSQKRKYGRNPFIRIDSIFSSLFFNMLSMNKKFVAIVAAGVVLLTGLVWVPVAAQAEEVGPGDTLYPVDLALEKVKMTFSSDEGDVALLREQMDERVMEAEDAVEDGDETEEISEAMELYNQKVEELEALLESLCGEESTECDERMVEKVEHVGFATLKHIEVLAGVYEKQVEKGNENAAESILAAMEKSLNGHDKAIESLQKSKNKDNDEDSGVVEEELRAGKDKAKQKIENAKSRGNKHRN